MKGQWALLGLLALMFVACGPSAPSTSQPTSTPALAPRPSPTPSPTPGTSPVAEKAKIALAQRLGADPSQLALAALEPVTWPDGSLGCPEPGKLYTQATVPGFRAVFLHNGQQRAAHTNQDGSLVVFCTATRGEVGEVSGSGWQPVR